MGVMPEVQMPDGEISALLGKVAFGWRDQAHMEFHTHWPDHYTTFTRVGVLDGTTFFKFVDWINSFYVPRYRAFNPVEIVVPSSDGKDGHTVLRSRMCHDFVTDSLWRLYEDAKYTGRHAEAPKDFEVLPNIALVPREN